MRLLKALDAGRNGLVYTGPTTVLALGVATARWVTRLWDSSGDTPPIISTPEQITFAAVATRHGGLPFLRAHGFWPAEAALPNSEDQPRLLEALYANAQPDWRPFAFAPDAATVLFAHTGPIDETYQTHFYLRKPDGTVHNLWRVWGMFTTSAAFSPNGQLVALSNGLRVVSVWDVTECREVCRLEQSDKTSALGFLTDDRLAVAAGRTVRVWEVSTAGARSKFRAFRKYADALAVSPDRTRFAAGSRDGLVRVWDADSGHELNQYDWHIGAVHRVAFSPDGTTAAAAGDTGVAVWDVD